MTESSLVQTFIADAKATLRGACILKHADRFTAHIPDIEILLMDKTSWLEVKYPRGKRRLKDIVETGQVLMCHELQTVCGGRAWFLVYDGDRKETQVWMPRVMARHLYPTLVMGVEANPLQISAADLRASDNVMPLLREHGVLTTKGFDNVLPLKVITSAMKYPRGHA